MPQNFGLGRGLASLIPPKNKISKPQDDFNYFGAKTTDPKNYRPLLAEGKKVEEAEISRIISNPHQPRKDFNEERLRELSESIKKNGIIQPIIVTKRGEQLEIIAGERRLKAAKLAGLTKVPVIIREADEQQKLELAIIENIQRHDLNPIEEANSYLKLSKEFGLSQEEVAQKVGKSRSAVANKLRLLQLPVEIQRALQEEKITEGHAKAILAVIDPEKQRALFELILKNSLTVRQTENKTQEISVRKHKRLINIDPEVKEAENKLANVLGTKVKLQKSGQGGRIIIEYYSPEELESILKKIS
jgi:ParB family transcriptional regulator, chromosome partitioning protein